MKPIMKKGEDFIPPDGGWGWMIIFAAGFSNLSALPFLQQFGLLFRDKFERLGISSSETTTIINIHSAMNSFVGLANGPVFRTFSYRQVSLTGATVVVISLMLTTFSYNFITYLITFSILYGAGYGISSSANALALNTYWKNRRRLATSLSWTTTGLGPMLWPHIITLLIASFGENGTLLIISAISLHAIACALLLQPVEWHSKPVPQVEEEGKKLLKDKNKEDDEASKNKFNNKKNGGYFSSIAKLKNMSAFSSQYLYNEDDPLTPGYEITDPGTPMMLRANDGYFSQSRQSRSKVSSREASTKTSRINSAKPSMANLNEYRSQKSSTLYLNDSKKNSSANLRAPEQEMKSKPKRQTSLIVRAQIPESEIEDFPTLKAPHDLKAEEKAVVDTIDPIEAKDIAEKAEKHMTNSKSVISFKKDYQYEEKSLKDNQSSVSLNNYDDLSEIKYMKDNHSNQSKIRSRKKSNNFNYESEVLKQASKKLEQYLNEKENTDQGTKVNIVINDETDDEDDNIFKQKKGNDEVEEKELTFCEKIYLFFDLDLLKDYTFINLMLGMTLASFNELNFSILTPFILGDYGFTKPEVAFFMSLLGGIDICVRFCIPFFAGKVGWENNSFFLFGVLTMAMGRVVLAYSQNYSLVLFVAVIIGFGKGLRTVFVALVIPTHVPLHKLPGASGLQLITSGIVCVALGPLVGWIKDNASTGVLLHSLNILTYLTAVSWGLEKYIRTRRQKVSNEELTQS
ncbi:uncharacterized protein LOC106131089 isoform X1 [Amyelois transitella]|uniref:uncharacterized protein LOC106131089 isoform X1 n=1 Tax=Amyelois transitella TaxID=680683 RepID=UPI0029900713|nr:uncharacterized protein LOC106131089 isoform X1 [Amyelois transitella]XP_060800803.1 uncharacterized protein LOC106131089 isoform X1 [Amyelois transitella]